jgi:spore coat-associated protein N
MERRMLTVLRRRDRRVAASVLVVLVVGLAWTRDTLAVFTDQDTNGSNTFTAATISLSLNPASAVVSYATMQPGDSVTNSMVVTNNGNATLRYAISSSATNADGKGLKDQLTLTIKTIDVTTPGTPCDNFDGTQLYTGDLDSSAGKLVGDNTQGAQAGDRSLSASTNETLCFRASLPSSTGNAYQGATTTATFTFDSEQTANN